MDEDALTVSDNVFLPIGSPSTANLSLFTLDNTEVFGVSQSGAFISAPGFLNASFAGWAVGQYPLMVSRIGGAGQLVSVQGVIDDGLPSFAHPELGTVFGPRDITSVLAWDVDPSAVDAEITSSLDGEPAVVEAQLASTAIPCRGKSCRVLIVCISPDVAVPCNNRITISARPPRRSGASRASGHLGDDTSTKARMFAFASGNAVNIPQGQAANVKLKLTKKGRQVAQSGTKKLKGVMSISNVAGFAALRIPIKIKFK